jgi:Dolichyl-phosphate-mannose-protein mannosyltransferase
VPARRTCFALLAAASAISRLVCRASGVRFDIGPLYFYWNYIDPALLRNDFWRSIFYLEQQPPAFNFFLGTVLHLAPSHPTVVFQPVYFALGLASSFSLFALMDRMGVDRRIALAIALVFALSPSTILYENTLTYEYPLTALFCIAALFLHRFASSGKWWDATVFFFSIGLIAGIRSVFHWIWFALILLLLLLRFPEWRRPIVQAAAIPTLLLTAIYLEHVIVFHEFTPGGRVYMGQNLSAMTARPVSRGDIEALIASGRISPLLRRDIMVSDIFGLDQAFGATPAESTLSKIVPVPPQTGIAVLDDCRKSTKKINWNCTWAANVAQAYLRDSLVVFRAFPRAYWISVGRNLLRYFLPDTEGWPFDGRDDANHRILSGPLRVYNLLTAGEWPPEIQSPWLAYIALPALLGYGIRRAYVLRGASGLTLVFMAGNTLYFSAIVMLFSVADQNRYRTEISAFFAVWLGLAATQALNARRAIVLSPNELDSLAHPAEPRL